MPGSLHELAEPARDRDLPGCRDIRLGGTPSPRLRRSLGRSLSPLASEAGSRISVRRDPACRFADAEMSCEAFAARTNLRGQGLDEDSAAPVWNLEAM
ncbi:MAG: hypothetical protein OXH99_15475 [Bryobacterales bacterium]|nr:hypothetical protein [Bryobacterales bacterium]